MHAERGILEEMPVIDHAALARTGVVGPRPRPRSRRSTVRTTCPARDSGRRRDWPGDLGAPPCRVGAARRIWARQRDSRGRRPYGVPGKAEESKARLPRCRQRRLGIGVGGCRQFHAVAGRGSGVDLIACPGCRWAAGAACRAPYGQARTQGHRGERRRQSAHARYGFASFGRHPPARTPEP